jgi:predicted metal-binding membrane protein
MNLSRSVNPQGLLWLGLFALILAAWVALFTMTLDVPPAGLAPDLWASLCGGPMTASYHVLFAMWALMAAAMMLPTFIPALRTFISFGHAGATHASDAAMLVCGYTLVWLGFAAAAAALQQWLAQLGLLAPDGKSLSLWLTAVLLLAAGLYQFSVLKAACLAKCRMPLTFFMERWAPGPARAFRMGSQLGLACLGCCWALMALAFVGGTMNLVWMGAATLFMALEKLPDIGRPLTHPMGAILILAAVAATLAALNLF